jgi:hypothetical protein
MAILATRKESSFEPLPEGAYPARIYRIIHIGTTFNPMFGNMQNKVNIGFEFPTELKVFDSAKGEQPYVLSQDYTLSFGEKSNLKRVIDATDPKALKPGEDGLIENYDVSKLLGKTCLVTVVHKPSTKDKNVVYANIGAVTVLPKGMTCPEAINEPQSLDYDNFNFDLFNSLPEFMKNKIKESDEYKAMTEDKNKPPFDENADLGDIFPDGGDDDVHF